MSAPSRRVVRRRLLAAALGSALLIGGSASAVLWPSGGVAQAPAAGDETLPQLGAAGPRSVVFGAVTSGPQDGETWAYERLPVEAAEPRVDGRAVPFGPTDAKQPDQQLALLRHTAATGWQIIDVPRGPDGAPIRGFVPNPSSARMTPTGAAVLLGLDPSRALGDDIVLTVRKAGGSFRALPAPGAPLLRAADDPQPGDPAEVLATDRGSGRVNAAIADQPGVEEPVVMLTPLGRAVDSAVLVHDRDGWHREPLQLSGTPTRFQVAAIAAAAPERAWLVGTGSDGAVQLLRRDPGAAGGPAWVPVALPATAFTDAAKASAAGLSDLAPLGGRAQTLTISGTRVWVDVGAKDGSRDRHATLLVDPERPMQQRVESWCDVAAAACDHPLGMTFSTSEGYRSYAWPGPAAGERVITNPLRRSGDPASNQGTWAKLSGTSFTRRAGGGDNYRPGGAFRSPSQGWLQGPVEIGAAAPPQRLAKWPAPLRAPLTAVAAEPGTVPGAVGAAALAVGVDGAVLRYQPGQGWVREFLLSAQGTVVKDTLRGVAWPEAGLAHAVGDLGAMWQWRSDTGLWERDPAARVGEEANFTGVAFDPADPQRGFAVGKQGTLLAYDKTWTQQALPAGFAQADFTSIAFAGRQAIAVSSAGVLVQDAPGAAWHPEADVTALLDALPGTPRRMVAAAGLPDGGAVLGGRDLVLIRDGAGQPWRTSSQPLSGLTVSAAAAVREGGAVRAVVAAVPELPYPLPDEAIEVEPDAPPPLIPAYPLPGDGYLLRETASGWQDEQRSAFGGSGDDRPAKSDPVLALLLSPSGDGWAVGGWTGQSDSAGRGVSGNGSGTRAVRDRVQTAAVQRYALGGSPAAAPQADQPAAIPLSPGVVRFAIGGHPQCAKACADLSSQSLGPDRMLRGALDLAQQLAGQPWGPRAFVSTGGRNVAGSAAAGDADEEQRFAALLQPRLGLPIFNATSAGDLDPENGDAANYRGAFAAGSAPQGTEVVNGVSPIDPRSEARPAVDTAASGRAAEQAGDVAGASSPAASLAPDSAAASTPSADAAAGTSPATAAAPAVGELADATTPVTGTTPGAAATPTPSASPSASPSATPSATPSPTVAPAGPKDPAGARTHFAFDSTGLGGRVRVVVIDNSAGSLEASDPHQLPDEPQEPWLIATLDAAWAAGIPTIVVGSRDLNSQATPPLNVATDADHVAQLLVDHGASAYFYDRPEENRSGAIPSGGATTIPSFGTGTLGYRSGVDDAGSVGLPDALFGDGGFLLTEINAAQRDPATNRAPVSVRLIPVIDQLTLDAVDGTLLRRSRPALLRGIGRRPVSGDRWGPAGGGGMPSPTGADPYTSFPADLCRVAGCSTRIEPEYSFRSSAPDVLDFVALDPASGNPRKPLLGADDKVISDSVSGLVCPFNSGTALVTVSAGGRAFTQPVTVLPGSVLRPCGTRPLDPSRIKTQSGTPSAAVPPPPPPAAVPADLPLLVPPPPPAPEAPAPAPARPQPRPAPEQAVPLFAGFAALAAKVGPGSPPAPPPPAPGFFAQPIPPGGATVRVTEKEREREVATEESQAYAAIAHDDALPLEPFIAGMALIAALAGTTIRPGRRRHPAYVRVRATNTTVRSSRRRQLP